MAAASLAALRAASSSAALRAASSSAAFAWAWAWRSSLSLRLAAFSSSAFWRASFLAASISSLRASRASASAAAFFWRASFLASMRSLLVACDCSLIAICFSIATNLASSRVRPLFCWENLRSLERSFTYLFAINTPPVPPLRRNTDYFMETLCLDFHLLTSKILIKYALQARRTPIYGQRGKTTVAQAEEISQIASPGRMPCLSIERIS